MNRNLALPPELWLQIIDQLVLSVHPRQVFRYSAVSKLFADTISVKLLQSGQLLTWGLDYPDYPLPFRWKQLVLCNELNHLLLGEGLFQGSAEYTDSILDEVLGNANHFAAQVRRDRVFRSLLYTLPTDLLRQRSWVQSFGHMAACDRASDTERIPALDLISVAIIADLHEKARELTTTAGVVIPPPSFTYPNPLPCISPAIIAARDDRWDYLEHMLDSGLIVHLETFEELGIELVHAGSVETLGKLIEYRNRTGAPSPDLNCLLGAYQTALFEDDMLRTILRAGTMDDELQYLTNQTHLHHQFTTHNLDYMRWIASKGVEFSSQDLVIASEMGWTGTVRYLLDDCRIPIPRPFPRDFLYGACKADDVAMVRLFTDAGVDLRALSGPGESSRLRVAAMHGSPGVIRLWEELYGQLEAPMDHSWYLLDALENARDEGLYDTVSILLKHGVKLDACFISPYVDGLGNAANLALGQWRSELPWAIIKMIEQYVDEADGLSKMQKTLLKSPELSLQQVEDHLLVLHWHEIIGWQVMPKTGNDLPASALVPINGTI